MENAPQMFSWSQRASTQTLHSLAQSTLRTYDGYVTKYIQFCNSTNREFSDESQTSTDAEFLCLISVQSRRPESVLKSCAAAINCLFEALGKNSPIHSPDV